MDFGGQVKKIRQQHALTQEQLAQQLHVSRQTVSSWENNRNLPDLAMVVTIAQLFQISLDQLILGDETMAKKLVKDGSQVRLARLNIATVILFVLGGACFLSAALIGSSLDSNGVLQEPFFLIPIGYLLLFGGLIVLLVNLGLRLYHHFRTK